MPPVSEYQDLLHSKISELHNSGLGYRRISYWLNDNGYKTPRGHVFKGSQLHSILKKRRIREERINRPYELTFDDWYIRDAKWRGRFVGKYLIFYLPTKLASLFKIKVIFES